MAAVWMSLALAAIGTWSIIHGDSAPLVVAVRMLIMAGLMTWGLWRLRRWALVLSLLMAIAALGASYWWFVACNKAAPEARLPRGLWAFLQPFIVPFWLWPLIWLAYLTDPDTRTQFGRQANDE